MSEEKYSTQVTRRGFLKTVGLGGLGAVAASGLAATAVSAVAPSQTIPKRRLGKTGAEVSILSLGGMFDTINNQLLLKQALSWGITHWDTAEAYGNGMSEEGMGRFFTRNPDARKQIFLVTKLTPKAGNFTERFEKSLQRLKTEYVDLFLVHGISGVEEMTPAIKEWAAAMKQAGKMKFFGFSTHANMEDCLLGAANLDWIDAVMFTYNFRLMPTDKMKQAVAACVAAGIGLTAMKSQGGGPVKTDSQAELDMAGRFLERGFTDKQAKLKAIWENPHLTTICSQMPNLTILASNVAAARDQTTLAREDFEALQLFAQESCVGYCAGCGSICSQVAGGVPINDVMRCLMYHRDYNDPDLARSTFASLGVAVREGLVAQDYAAAEQACPQGLAIATLMHEAATLLG